MIASKFKLPLFSIALAAVITSCNKDSEIVHRSLNEEIYLEQDVSKLEERTDEISLRIDSIVKAEIDTKIISTGQQSFDLDNDGRMDIAFEIIDLRLFNGPGFPSHFDTLAARVIPLTVQIVDNSTYGYCDAFDLDQEISKSENWVVERCVLGTFANAGKFQGKGEKYLPIKFNSDQYGWIKIECSANSNELHIIECAYNKNGDLKAGEK